MSTLKSGINHAFDGLNLGQRIVIPFEIHCIQGTILEEEIVSYLKYTTAE